MKKLIYPALIATVITTSAFTVATSNKWTVKEDAYTVKFNSKKGKEFGGIFKGLKSDIQFDETNMSSSRISASIEASSVNTGNGMRNKHAGQGLGAEQYPTIKFESTTVTKVGSSYEASGKLTIKDVTKEIKLPFTFTKNSDGGVFEGKFLVVPSEYHVEKKGTPELLEIELNIPVTK
jgi:polyisoprenoid-binding protein YceI